MTSTMSEVDAFFSAGGAPAPERENGRYKLPDPVTGEQRSYQTASNYGYPLLDQFGLTKWRNRQLLIGLAQRPDLIAMLSTMGTAAGEDNGKLDEIVETALSVAGTSVKANRGTAIHEAFRAADEGRAYPPEYEPYVANYRAELTRHGLTVGLVERLVVAPGFGASGRLDRTFVEADGTHVLGDIKSTGHLERQAHEISVQLKIYQCGTHMRSADGKTWEPIPRGKHPLRDDYAIVVHVDQDTAAVTLYRVDLRIGGIGAQLAEQVRGWRKSGPVLLPYVPPGASAVEIMAQVTRGTAPSLAQQITVPREMTEVNPVNPVNPLSVPNPWGHSPDSADNSHVPANPSATLDVFNGPTVTGPPVVKDTPGFGVPERPDPVSAGIAAGMAAPVADGRVQTGMAHPDNMAAAGDPPLLTATELMKPNFTKAKVQQYCRDHGITEDLAHTKAKLVEMLNKRGKLAATVGTHPTVAPTPTVHPAQTEAFRQMTLSKIANAATVGELNVINREVVQTGGDQAWTDAMTEAARVRVGQLDAQNAAPAPNPVLAEINAADSSQKLADIWERVTVGGSVPGNWTPVVHQASVNRLAEINAARPAAPANPFG